MFVPLLLLLPPSLPVPARPPHARALAWSAMSRADPISAVAALVLGAESACASLIVFSPVPSLPALHCIALHGIACIALHCIAWHRLHVAASAVGQAVELALQSGNLDLAKASTHTAAAGRALMRRRSRKQSPAGCEGTP
jgi:hypothetical protein